MHFTYVVEFIGINLLIILPYHFNTCEISRNVTFLILDIVNLLKYNSFVMSLVVFSVQSDNLCFLIRLFSPLIFNVNIDMIKFLYISCCLFYLFQLFFVFLPLILIIKIRLGFKSPIQVKSELRFYVESKAFPLILLGSDPGLKDFFLFLLDLLLLFCYSF